MERVEISGSWTGLSFLNGGATAARRLGWNTTCHTANFDTRESEEEYSKTIEQVPCLLLLESDAPTFVNVTAILTITLRTFSRDLYRGEFFVAMPGEECPSADVHLSVSVPTGPDSWQELTFDATTGIAGIPMPFGPEFAEFVAALRRTIDTPQGCG